MCKSAAQRVACNFSFQFSVKGYSSSSRSGCSSCARCAKWVRGDAWERWEKREIDESRNAFGTAYRSDERLLLCDFTEHCVVVEICIFGWRTGHAPCTARKDGQGTPCPYNCQQEDSEGRTGHALSLHFDTKGRRFWIDESFENGGKNGKLVKVAMPSAPHTALTKRTRHALSLQLCDVAALRLPFGVTMSFAAFGTARHFVTLASKSS